MDQWVDFSYREFYDVPRSIVVALEDGYLLLESVFSTDADEYSDHYDAYLLPGGVDLSGSWTDLSRRALRPLGAIKVDLVQLDESRRKSVNLTHLNSLLGL